MGFIDDIKARAKTSKKTIVLPETEDIRTYEAAEAVLKEGTANLILVGSEEEIAKNKGSFDISGATIVDPAKSEKTDAYIAKLVELREKKGMTEEKARELLLTNYLYYGVMMVKMKDADGMVSGACHSTADTLRPSLQILKTKPGTKLVSAFFIMVVPDCEMGANGTFLFGDSGLEQNPDPEKLAAIALSSADSFRLLTEKEPVVALLSHSTKGSAKHADVDKVVEATKIAKENGTTRATASMDKAATLDKKLIFAIGNAPTALVRLYELIEDGKLNPELIIGVPVGFVNVVQSKELIMDSGAPYIVARGRKGGSNIAACICNALLYMIDNRRD